MNPRVGQATEAQIQQSIIQYISITYKNVVAFHVPNAGKRSFQTGIFFKKQGMISGIPDICVCWKDYQGGRCGFLEVKTPTGRLTANQRSLIARLEDIKIPVAVVRSMEECQNVLKSWGVE